MAALGDLPPGGAGVALTAPGDRPGAEPWATAELSRIQREEIKRILEHGDDDWDVLQLTAPSSQDDIRKSYRRLALLLHPDKNKHGGAREAFNIVGRAYKKLTNQQTEGNTDGPGDEPYSDMSSMDVFTSVYPNGLPPDFLSEEVLQEVAGRLGPEWYYVGACLSVDATYRESLIGSGALYAVPLRMLEFWKRRCGNDKEEKLKYILHGKLADKIRRLPRYISWVRDPLDRIFPFLARELYGSWRRVGFSLGLEQSDLDELAFTGPPPDEYQSKFNMLLHWRQNSKNYLALLLALQENNRKDLADWLGDQCGLGQILYLEPPGTHPELPSGGQPNGASVSGLQQEREPGTVSVVVEAEPEPFEAHDQSGSPVTEPKHMVRAKTLNNIANAMKNIGKSLNNQDPETRAELESALHTFSEFVVNLGCELQQAYSGSLILVMGCRDVRALEELKEAVNIGIFAVLVGDIATSPIHGHLSVTVIKLRARIDPVEYENCKKELQAMDKAMGTVMEMGRVPEEEDVEMLSEEEGRGPPPAVMATPELIDLIDQVTMDEDRLQGNEERDFTRAEGMLPTVIKDEDGGRSHQVQEREKKEKGGKFQFRTPPSSSARPGDVSRGEMSKSSLKTVEIKAEIENTKQGGSYWLSHNYLWDASREGTREDLLKNMERGSLQIADEAPKDPSSMFYSILKQLQAQGAYTEITVHELRLMLIKYVRTRHGIIQIHNGEETSELNIYGVGLEDYFWRMSDPATPGDHFMLLAAADYFKRSLLVQKSATRDELDVVPLVISGSALEEELYLPTLLLGHYDTGQYESLKNVDDRSVLIGLTDGMANQLSIAEEFSETQDALCFFWPDSLVPLTHTKPLDLPFCYQLLESLMSKSKMKFLELLLHSKTETDVDVKGKGLSRNISQLVRSINAVFGENTVRIMQGSDKQSISLILCLRKTSDPDGFLRQKVKEASYSLMQMEKNSSKQHSGDSKPDEEDRFLLSEEAHKLRIQKALPELFYKGCQSKLGDMLLKRAEHILCQGRPLNECFDECALQIYTTNINMLENQTRQRIQDPNSEFFKKEVYNDPPLLNQLALDSVKKYNLRSVDVLQQVQRLQSEAKEKPRKLFLIIADEAHWGIREKQVKTKKGVKAGEKQEEEEETRELERISGAYNVLVNSWSKYKNALILQVTATPYNLLTENTRLDLSKTLPDDNIAASMSEPKSNTKTTKSKRLHHMKWSEGIDYYLEKGLVITMYCMFTKQNCHLSIEKATSTKEILAWEPLLEEKDDEVLEFLLEGTTENVTIKSSDGALILVADLNTKQVGFMRASEIGKKGKYCHEFSLDVSYGEDAMCILTKDTEFQLHIPEEKPVSLKKVRAREKGQYRDPFSDPPYRNEVFMVRQRRTLEDIGFGKQYISLNSLVASAGEEEQFKRYLRADDTFKALTSKVKHDCPAPIRNCYILGADYSYYILIIYKLRQAKLEAKTFRVMTSRLDHALGDYTTSTDALVGEFLQELRSSSKGEERISADMVESTINAIGDFYSEKAEEEFSAYLNGRLHEDHQENISEAETVLSFVTDSCLFARKATLEELSRKLKPRMEGEWKARSQKSKDLEEAYRAFRRDFEYTLKTERIEENETCRVVNDLAMKRNSNILEGKMKILRIKGGNQKKILANQIFSTLCLARRMASPESYSFEILRDYDNFKINDLEKAPKEVQEKTAVFRIRQLFQQRECDEIDPRTYRRCLCPMSDPRKEDLRCNRCGHLHKKISSYEDLDKLPVLLIVVNKGRMGDTFPPSFNFMDMRLTPEINYLSTFVQELGRLCRYTDRADEASIPYALLTKNVETMVMNARQQHGIYHGISKFCKGKDHYVKSKVNIATKDSMDFGNKSRDSNRLLLEAETQIGKTGVYINFASKVRKALTKVMEDSDTDEESLSELSDDDDPEENLFPSDDKAKWLRPHWSYLDKAKPLPKEVTHGKYCDLYGSYVYGQIPSHCANINLKHKANHAKKARKRDDRSGTFRAYRKRHWDKCQACKESGEISYMRLKKDFMGSQVEVLVPRIHRMRTLLKVLHERCDVEETYAGQDELTLRTWIFTPSAGRHERGYLNLKHTMVDQHGRPARYVQIIVVPSSDFEAYVQTWGGSHAIISLPESMPLCGSQSPESGGVGYSRSFIQQLAQTFKLGSIFMLDDSILNCKQVKFIQTRGKEVVQRSATHCSSYEPVSLFSVLHDLENQVYKKDVLAPVRKFVPHPDVFRPNIQESYTGPWSCYGIVGVLKNRGTIVKIRQPFIKTHVFSLVLLNIKALTEKGILYKPQKVWEDLDINNQADEEGLYVVKYSRWSISKVNIRDWLQEVCYWDDETVMTKPTHSIDVPTSPCIKIIGRFLNKYFPISHILCSYSTDPSIKLNPDNGVSMVVDTVKTHQPSPFLLLAFFTGGDVNFTPSDLKVMENHLSMSGNLLLLLPASICESYDLRNRAGIIECLSKGPWAQVPEGSQYDVITSGNVASVSVSLILVTIVTPGVPRVSGAALKPDPDQTKPKPAQKIGGEVVPTIEDMDLTDIDSSTGNLSLEVEEELPSIKDTLFHLSEVKRFLQADKTSDAQTCLHSLDDVEKYVQEKRKRKRSESKSGGGGRQTKRTQKAGKQKSAK